MIKIYNIPCGLEEIKKVFGNPDADNDGTLDANWYVHQTAVFDLPVGLRLSWAPGITVHRIRAHEAVGAVLVDAISEIAWLYRENFDQVNYFGGVFNFRAKRGGQDLSTHSWGIAIDLNPHLGRFGSAEDVATYPQNIVDVMREHGFVWGGEFDTPDAMHFQAAEGY